MFVRSRALPAVLAMAVLVSACGADSSTGPANDPATLDQALTAFSNPAIAGANTAFFDAGVAAPALGLARCAYAAASQSFVCTTFSSKGVAVDQTFTLLTAAGAPQSAFDAATTDAVNAKTTMVGTLNENGTTLDVDAQQNLTLSGLVLGPHTLNGTSTTKLKGVIADIFGSSALDATLTTSATNLVLPAKAAVGASLGPRRGRSSSELGDRQRRSDPNDPDLDGLHGTSTVNIYRTGAGGTQACKMDLDESGSGV